MCVFGYACGECGLDWDGLPVVRSYARRAGRNKERARREEKERCSQVLTLEPQSPAPPFVRSLFDLLKLVGELRVQVIGVQVEEAHFFAPDGFGFLASGRERRGRRMMRRRRKMRRTRWSRIRKRGTRRRRRKDERRKRRGGEGGEEEDGDGRLHYLFLMYAYSKCLAPHSNRHT